MKKILTHLTGIVFLITILIAFGCGSSEKQNGSALLAPTDESADVATPDRAPKAVSIFLKDTSIDGRMHLLMSNEKHPEWKVIDDLVTLVYCRDTVVWRKGEKSNIDEIKYIKIKEVYGTGFITEGRLIRPLDELVIPDSAKPGIMVYEIGFTVKKDTTTHTIDPYLRLPKEQ